MFDLDKAFATDESLEENGVWVTMDEKSAIKVARINNKNFKAEAAKLKNGGAAVAAKYTKEIPDDVLIQLIAKTILLDWRGIALKGEELPYSRENAVMVMTQYKDFMTLVVELANERETFRQAEIEEGKKTLKKS